MRGEECLRCALLDAKWDELYLLRESHLIEVELIDSQMAAIEAGIHAHDVTGHEDAEGEPCGRSDCENCNPDNDD